MNQCIPDMSSVVPVSHVMRKPFDGQKDFDAALSEATSFIKFYDWVSAVKETWVGVALEGIVYIFLFEIETRRPEVDRWIWVVVGDIPPAYIPCSDALNPYEVLDGYIGAMEEWVDAARQGKSVARLVPVNLPASEENADRLDGRLKFLDQKILPTLTGASATL